MSSRSENQSAADQLRDAVQRLVDKFKADEAQGYRSRDRQYAIHVLSFALKEYETASTDEHYAELEIKGKI